MDATEKIDITFEKLQSILERELGINPDNSEALELLWEVQRERAANLYQPVMGQSRSVGVNVPPK